MTDAVRDPGPDDLDLIKNVLYYYPGVVEVLTLAEMIDGLGYPINSLEEVLRGAENTVADFRLMGRTYDFKAVRRAVPAYYFPIVSRDDLVAKLVELHRISRIIAARRSRAARELQRRTPS